MFVIYHTSLTQCNYSLQYITMAAKCMQLAWNHIFKLTILIAILMSLECTCIIDISN